MMLGMLFRLISSGELLIRILGDGHSKVGVWELSWLEKMEWRGGVVGKPD